jgi:uncharacterized membrane protein
MENINKLHKDGLSKFERLGLFVVNKLGTVGFFILLAVWTFGWLGWNMFAPPQIRFDPFPGFVLWLFISNVIQLILLPLIMIGQNLQSKHSEILAENDYKTDLRVDKEIKEIKKILEEIKVLIK